MHAFELEFGNFTGEKPGMTPEEWKTLLDRSKDTIKTCKPVG